MEAVEEGRDPMEVEAIVLDLEKVTGRDEVIGKLPAASFVSFKYKDYFGFWRLGLIVKVNLFN